ncbi:MAG: LysE family translocator [Pseudooceanicola sp.]|nr:LysE family translocator [Pseudooceanicola sp.]
MSQQLLAGLIAFAFVSSVTPGPNNLMLMASGANFGFRRTIPHMLGIAIGFTVMIVALGAGLARLLDVYPAAHTVLKAVAVVYMLWLAWKIARAAPPGSGSDVGRPMTFLQAAAFQWVNPKAWAMAMTALAAYTPEGSLAAVALVAAVFGAINLPSVGCWALLGQQMARILTSRRRLLWFNGAMALLLIASLWPVVMA